MSLGLHPQCQQRMKELVAQHIPSIKVTHQMFVERSSTAMLLLADAALPGNGDIRQRLERYIGEMPFIDFATQFLSKKLYERDQYDKSTEPLPLTSISGYDDQKTIANNIVDEFESLPWSYSLTIELPKEVGGLFAKSLGSFALSDSIRLITPNESFVAQFPLQGEAVDKAFQPGLLLILNRPEWKTASTYVQFDVQGFIGQYGDTATSEEVLSLLKAFCGLSIALRLFKVKRTYRSIPTQARAFVHRNVGSIWRGERIYELDQAFSETFNDLVLHDLDGYLGTESEKVRWMQSVLSDMACVFRNQTKAEKIILASQWLLDSYSGRNDLLSFVQTVVVMEILLGEKAISDLLGLGELLRNRCAYLIGDSHKEREEILTEFKQIYELRSRIVHRGKAKLNLAERVLFSKLQWMCRRVIQEEVKLLKEDLSTSEQSQSS
jgi:hypothetical protein